MGPKVGGLVSEVRISQEVDNRYRHLPAFELWQDITVDVRATDSGIAEESTIGLGEQLSVDVNRKALTGAIAARAAQDQSIDMPLFERRDVKSLPHQQYFALPERGRYLAAAAETPVASGTPPVELVSHPAERGFA